MEDFILLNVAEKRSTAAAAVGLRALMLAKQAPPLDVALRAAAR